MAKFRYRIEAGNHGGELTVGEVSEEFVEYWKEEDKDELIEVVKNSDTGEANDSESKLEKPWFEISDFEHLNSPYADEEWKVFKVPVDGSDDRGCDEQVWEGEPDSLYSRECFISDDIEEEEDEEETVPVLAVHTSERGNFSCWFLETDEEFDPENLVFGSIETDIGEFVDAVYYNKEQLEENSDEVDLTTRSWDVQVGFLNKKLHDKKESFTLEKLEEDGYF